MVEQAADIVPNFKLTKSSLKVLDNPHKDSNPIVHTLEKQLQDLETGKISTTKVVRLRPHKKKALMSTIPNLTEATGIAYSIKNVRSGFVANGQIDPLSHSVPSLSNMIHKFRGNINGTCLEDGEKLVEKYFEEMHTNGHISEATYDLDGIPKDIDSKGRPVESTNAINLENRHRAKILSSENQIKSRQNFIDKKE